ncbi:MAG: hypothetical protein IPJ88_06705 [Myxococcales bacterium]|nr:MAG: hypothetical protein IPJ88_06705 [Myxococcales bacterium]
MFRSIAGILTVFVTLQACGAPAPVSETASAPTLQKKQSSRRIREIVPTGRLPRDVRPLHYYLDLEVDPDQATFSGRARIELSLKRRRHRIWMHGQDLKVRSVTVSGQRVGREHATWKVVNKTGLVALRFPKAMGPGKVNVEIEYSTTFAPGLAGLYRVEQDKHNYAYTQFEPISARRAFPCLDEPAFKTPFDLSLTVESSDVAVANTPELHSRDLGNGKKRVRFSTTRPMPTYLVAMAVGPFDVVQAQDIPSNERRNTKIPLRGITTKGKGKQIQFGLDKLPKLLTALEDYFDIAYPYSKLDIIAIPDFKSGAMENVGAITFREQYIMMDKQAASSAQLLTYYAVMTHELAHQWFGNLVTMYWWHDLWLNESFATWMAARTLDELMPEFNMKMQELRAVHAAMDADSLVSARQIRQPIRSDHDIENAFDAITYTKGGAILSMFESWMGAEAFRDGIRRYLRAHEDGNARTEDFLTALVGEKNKEVAASFSSFLHQPGVPLIESELECKGREAKLRVTQNAIRLAAQRHEEANVGRFRCVYVLLRAIAGKLRGNVFFSPKLRKS